MNTFAGPSNALFALVIFLLARTIAGAAAAFARPAGFILAFATGLLLATFPGMNTVPGLPLPRAAAELAAGLLLFSSAFLTLRTLPSRPAPSWTATGLPRTLVAQALPATGVLAPLLGKLLFPGSFSPETLWLGLVLTLSLWLFRQGRPLDLVFAAGVWLVLDFGSFPMAGQLPTKALPVGILPYVLLIGSGSLVFFLSRSGTTKEGGLVWNLARDGLIAASVALTIGFRLVGASWGLAALAGGIITGLAGRNKQQRGSTAMMEALSFEAALACAFAAGLGLRLTDSSLHLSGTALFATAALAIPALRGLMSPGAGKPRERMASLLPSSALPLAMIVSLGMNSPGMEGLGLRSLTFGLILAYLAALPSTRSTLAGTVKARQGQARWRPLVAVSRRGNATGILAFAYSLADPDQPIRSVCVAATPGSQGPDAAEAEETLVRAVAAGASKAYRILPSLVTAASTADGLARAALERRSDCILTGWHENPTPSDPESRSVIDALVRLSPATVISVRKPEIFNRAKRLVFVTMAGSMNEEGYREATAIAIAAWGRHPSGMETIVVGGPADELASALRIDQERITTIPAWRDLAETVRRGGSQAPAFFVAAARPDWPGWNPGTERIPLVLVDSFPDSALAVFYLKAPSAPGDAADDEHGSEAGRGDGNARTDRSTAGRRDTPVDSATPTEQAPREGDIAWPPIIQVAIQSGRIMTTMKEAVLVDALSTLTKVLFPGDKTAASRMASDFSTVARTEPIELAPGILLLHAHAKGIAVPALAIGVNRDGWRLVALDEPVRIIIMLVSPVEAGPAAHLEALTQIAKAIRDHGFALAILDPQRNKEFSPA
jgi:hypothetical protein